MISNYGKDVYCVLFNFFYFYPKAIFLYFDFLYIDTEQIQLFVLLFMIYLNKNNFFKRMTYKNILIKNGAT